MCLMLCASTGCKVAAQRAACNKPGTQPSGGYTWCVASRTQKMEAESSNVTTPTRPHTTPTQGGATRTASMEGARLLKVSATCDRLSLSSAHHHLRGGGTRGHFVEVQTGIECDEAHVGALTPWQVIKRALYRLCYDGQDAQAYCSVRHIDEEDVCGRHRRAHLH